MASVAKEGAFQNAEVVAESLSPRQISGQHHTVSSSSVLDIFHLDPIIQRVQQNLQQKEGFQLVVRHKPKGIQTKFPSDRSLRSKSKSSNTCSLLYLMINYRFWNIQDVSRAPNLCRLKHLIHHHSFQVVSLCEPKMAPTHANFQSIRLKLQMNSALTNSRGSVWVFFSSLVSCDFVSVQISTYL